MTESIEVIQPTSTTVVEVISPDSPTIEVVAPPAPSVITVAIPGIQGAAGPQGIQGIQGIQGPTGNTGPANSLTIGTVNTGPAGSSASATITGTPPNQTLNLTIPAGPQGPTGAGSPDATTTTKGSIQLAGDLGGTAAAPTVPGLTTKVDTNDARLSDARTPTAHTHTASNISDSTTVGRSLITAADAAAARTAIGAGTSSLVIGTTGTTAKAGDYQPTSSNISDSTVVGRSLITAIDAAAARTAIGAGTSNLTIGTTSVTAKAGDYVPPAATDTVSGIVELATVAEAITGSDTARAITPASLRSVVDKGDKFDQATSIYNLRGVNTRRHRAALGLARLDTGIARIAFIGDSVTAGHSSTRGTNDPVTLLRQRLDRMGYRTGEFVNFYANLTEPRPVTTGTVTWQGITSGWVTFGSGATWTMTGSGRYMDLVLSNQSITNSSYQIDGGAAVPISTDTTATYKVMTIDLGTDGPHTFKWTNAAGSGFWYGAGFRPATGVVLENAGVSGAQTTDFLTATLGKANVLTATNYFDVDTFIIELGANDMNIGGRTAAQYKTSLLQIVDKCIATGADVMLAVTHTPVATNQANWNAFIQVQYEVADERNLPLLDLNDRLGWAASGDDFPGELYDVSSDGGHFTPAGNQVKAQAWLDLLAPNDNGGQLIRSATDTQSGIVELATTAEATAGTDTVRAVTPAGLKTVADTKISNGNGITEIRSITQAAYDALGTKVATTLYVIVG